MTEFLLPEKDPTAQREWAEDVLSWRAFWVTQLSGTAVLRQAGRILGPASEQAVEAYIANHRPAWEHAFAKGE
jgi:hypothetical protein